MRSAAVVLMGFVAVGCTFHQDEANNTDSGYVPPVMTPINLPLTEVNAQLTIVQSLGDTDAGVNLAMTDSAGNPVVLSGTQAFKVNGVPVEGPNEANHYTALVPASSNYAIFVMEPSHGAGTTNIAPPEAYAITTPLPNATAALSGFELQWSPFDATQTATISLSQVQAGTPESATFNLSTDTGSHTFSAKDLQQFVQGYPLTITLSKTLTQSGMVVFANATTTITRSQSEVVQPGP
jgi:hypothetical protein